jgi:hypothetical protein
VTHILYTPNTPITITTQPTETIEPIAETLEPPQSTDGAAEPTDTEQKMPSADTSEAPSAETSEQPSAETSEQPSAETTEKPATTAVKRKFSERWGAVVAPDPAENQVVATGEKKKFSERWGAVVPADPIENQVGATSERKWSDRWEKALPDPSSTPVSQALVVLPSPGSQALVPFGVPGQPVGSHLSLVPYGSSMSLISSSNPAGLATPGEGVNDPENMKIQLRLAEIQNLFGRPR